MSKSMVERYEQMLRQDPASTVFVELAKAFLERGENAKAIDVCQQGLTHHPKSVVGRVLWGKALISLGKASEAMNQFDQAVSIDRDNPHAYNLIGEVLLKKGLYRSALPVLRKASTLQPNDGRIKQWLDQTKAALAGGPAPSLQGSTLLEQATEGRGPGATVTGDDEGATAVIRTPGALPGDDGTMPTVVTQSYVPGQGRGAQVGDDELATQANLVPPGAPANLFAAPPPAVGENGRSTATQELPLIEGQIEVDDPFANVPKRTQSSDTVRGLTSTFDALSENAKQSSGLGDFAAFAQPPPPPSATLDGETNEPTVAVSEDLVREAQAAQARANAKGRLLDEVPSARHEQPAQARAQQQRQPPPTLAPVDAPAPRRGGGLLDDIPDMPEASSAIDVPKVELNPQATEAIAREYERELREKLAAKQAKKTFLQRHGLKLAMALGAMVVVAGLAGSFVYTRWRHDGKDLATALAEARTAIGADTGDEYRHALELLKVAETMDSTSTEVWALKAYAHAALFAEHGAASDDKAQAISALSRSGVPDKFPELALVIDGWLAGTPQAKRKVIESQLDKSEVHAEAGRLLLEEGKADEAFKRLERAVSLMPTNVRALAALGEYYLRFEDYEAVVKVLTGPAAQLSPKHAQRVLVLAQARLELGRELNDALAEVEALPPVEKLPSAQRARSASIHGRLLSAAGRHEEALTVLTKAQSAFPDRGFEIDMALGQAYRAAGQMERAQRAFESALKKDPKSEPAREGLGRVYLARSREKELVADKRLQGGGQKAALVRGIAYVRLGDLKNARTELAKTKVNDKVPAEAAIYLALADAQEEGGDRAVALLEKLAASTKRHRATVQVALARVYMQKNQLTKAMELLEQAAKDPADSEANALLGELLLEGEQYELAVKSLTRAVERNGSHAPSRRQLTRTLIFLGQLPEALKQAEGWVADNALSEEAQRNLGIALFYAGRFKEAEAALAKASKGLPDDAESWRMRARVQFALGDQKDAMKALEASNRIDPKDAQTFCDIGYAFVRQGNADTAIAAFQAAAREAPKAPCGKVGPVWAKPFGGKPAIRDMEALTTQPNVSSVDEAMALAALSRVQLNAGVMKDARANAEKATQLHPALGPGWLALGMVAQKQKDDATAALALTKAVETDGASSLAHLALADQLAKGDDESVKKALAEYQQVLSLSQSEADLGRVRRTVPLLQKRLQK